MPLRGTAKHENGVIVIPSGTELPALSIAEGQRSGVEESRAHGNEISRLPSATLRTGAALARNDVGALVYFRSRKPRKVEPLRFSIRLEHGKINLRR